MPQAEARAEARAQATGSEGSVTSTATGNSSIFSGLRLFLTAYMYSISSTLSYIVAISRRCIQIKIVFIIADTANTDIETSKSYSIF